jgi:hypothetical protein
LYIITERDDKFFLLDDFLSNNTASEYLQSLHDSVGSNDYFYLWPEELVIEETDSRLKIPGLDIISW